MRRGPLILLFVFFAVVSAFIIMQGFDVPEAENVPSAKPQLLEPIPSYSPIALPPEGISEPPAGEQGTYYVLKEREGLLAVFLAENLSTPLFVLEDVYVKTLPPADRLMLADGITVKGWTELMKRVEDFSS